MGREASTLFANYKGSYSTSSKKMPTWVEYSQPMAPVVSPVRSCSRVWISGRVRNGPPASNFVASGPSVTPSVQWTRSVVRTPECSNLATPVNYQPCPALQLVRCDSMQHELVSKSFYMPLTTTCTWLLRDGRLKEATQRSLLCVLTITYLLYFT